MEIGALGLLLPQQPRSTQINALVPNVFLSCQSVQVPPVLFVFVLFLMFVCLNVFHIKAQFPGCERPDVRVQGSGFRLGELNLKSKSSLGGSLSVIDCARDTVIYTDELRGAQANQ